jgi:hypothetical protein
MAQTLPESFEAKRHDLDCPRNSIVLCGKNYIFSTDTGRL